MAYLNRGGTWREALAAPRSGDATHQQVFGAYGTGDPPKILGSFQLTTWTADTGHWKCTYAAALVATWFDSAIDGKIHWGHKQTSKANCVDEFDWYSDGSSVWCYAATDPDARYTSVETAIRMYCAYTNHYSYITIQDLEVAYAKQWGINAVVSDSPYAIITGNVAHHCGAIMAATAIGIGTCASHVTINNNLVYECGTHGINATSDTGGVTDITISENEVYNCYHANIQAQDWVGAILDNVIMTKNFVYSTSDYSDTVTIASACGIYCEALSAATKIHDVDISYNIVFNIAGNGISIGQYSQDIDVYNNSLYLTLASCTRYSTGIMTSSTGCSGINVKNNIAMDMKDPCFQVGDKTMVTACDYNCWYQSAQGTDVYAQLYGVGNYHYDDFDAWKATTGWGTPTGSPDEHSLWEDPHFVNAGGTTAEDYKLASDSPCRDAGVDVSLTEDYWGTTVPQNSIPDIGAHEYEELITTIRLIWTK
jgi:hypothetical protein